MNGTVEVCVDHVIPVSELLIHIQKFIDAGYAGVVHQNIHTTELLGNLLRGFVDTGQICDVAVEGHVIAAIGAECFQSLLCFCTVAAENCHIGAALRHCLGNSKAQTTVASGDDHILAGQIKCVFHVFDCRDHFSASFPVFY